MCTASALVVCLGIFWTVGTAAKSITNGSELEDLRETVRDLSEKLQSLNTFVQTVIINEGGHYNPNNGVFLAPKTGIYLFSWTSSSYGGHNTATELVVENTVISSTGKYNAAGGYYSGSMTALCKMEKGYHAWIRTTGATVNSHYVYSEDNYPQTGFLGLFVQNI